ncbi:DUF885 domain-containing protein [Actimicrobium sp. CCI2.3]|uniref:DUF885 domain-containing protein n=1 Tax=Actimicrobium sp. CCI2.3 TaxID=3048616 RepID=UPI002AB3D151|nr:DUF885 domain-containing protein [Actimicrobium sp. CCI2.3]MDY7574760.1 DUF885 domain-containing protein [Actimicrobium sp. CCI2.3]MEB0020279.1 DUF885 domain-containing protein [Actimicrobium sp. CCI2.3]
MSLFSRRLLCVVVLAALVSVTQADLMAAPVAPVSGAVATASRSDLQVDRLATRYYLAQARFDPLGATGSGDNRFDDQLGIGIDPVMRARHFAELHEFQKTLHAMAQSTLSPQARLNVDLLDYELADALNFERFPAHLLPINQMDSVPVTLANYASGQGSQPLTTPAQYRAYLSRLKALPAWIDQAIVNMRSGMARGVVLPRTLVVSALPQFRQLVSARADGSVFYTPIRNLPANFSRDEQRHLTKAYRSLIDQRLNPSLGKLADFLENAYLPAARSSSGWDGLPDGAAWYLASVAQQTTTTQTPEQIHATGLSETARIQSLFATLGPAMGYTGAPADLPVWVQAQDRFRSFASEQEILDVYRSLDATLQVRLPALFSTLPKSALEIRPEPELTRLTASDHYTSPAADGSRPGVFWAVVNDPRQYSRVGMTTLFLHEGLPGHHFQIARMQEMTLPDFRKFGGNNAYVEGWALYAETLGKDMGLFEQPETYFGHLNDEMLRATRLVVDTGLHSKGWSREQAIQYLRDTLGYDEATARSAIERYMAWPGQALGYKIGSLKIMALRQRAQAAFGAKFSLPAFHEIVLGDGALPLSLLEAKVDRWIARDAAASGS